MYACFFGFPWGNREYLAAQTAVVDDRGSMDVPGSSGSTVQVIAGMLGVSCSGVEQRALHFQAILDGEHSRFCMSVGDGSGFGKRSFPRWVFSPAVFPWPFFY